VRNRRRDFLHKLTTWVAERFGTVCIEDLGLVALCRTRLAKSFYDAGIGEAMRQLEYKLAWRGGRLVRVDRFFPSSKRCHSCGWLYAGLTLGERDWNCDGCGVRHDRDGNAAMNLLLEGMNLPAGSGYVGVTPVEPTSATAGLALLQGVALKQELRGVAPRCTPER
jgi:putative transposase